MAFLRCRAAGSKKKSPCLPSEADTAIVQRSGSALGCGTGLAVGQSADMLALDEGHPSLAGRTADAIMDAFVFAAGRQAIDTVWRRGAVVVRQGRHVERDRIVARYRSALGSLLA